LPPDANPADETAAASSKQKQTWRSLYWAHMLSTLLALLAPAFLAVFLVGMERLEIAVVHTDA